MKEPEIKEFPTKDGSLKFYEDIHGHWVMVKDGSLEEISFERPSQARDFCKRTNAEMPDSVRIRPLSAHPSRICLDLPLHSRP